MTIRIRTLDEVHELALTYARGLNPEINTAPRSGFWFRSRAVAAVVMAANNAAAYLLKQIFPSEAEKAYLEKHAAQRGIERRSATAAVGKLLVITTTPTSGAPTVNIPIGTVYEHASGKTYTVTAANTTAKPAWTGKTVAYGTTQQRLVLNPHATSMAVDDSFTCDGQVLTVRAILPDTGTALVVEPYYAPGSAVAVGSALAAINACVLEVTCDETGEDGNLPSGTVLTISGAISNLGTGAIVLEMTGGAEDADDAELRSRVLAYMQERPGSGNRADYREWARETPDVGVVDAFVYPASRGLGTVDVVCFGPPGARALGTAANALVLAHLGTRNNGQDDVLVRQLADDGAENVTMAVTPGVGYEPDWTGTVTTDVGSTTSSLVIVASSTYDTIEIGDRVCIHSTVSGRTTLEQREVIGKSGATLTLDSALLAAPSAGVTVRPGGPLIAPLMVAIADYFDALGPGDTGGSRYPAFDVSGDAVLRVAKLKATALGVTGVLDVTVSAPAANVIPANFARPSLGVLTITHA